MSSNLVEIENQLPGVASWGIGKGLEGHKSFHALIYPNCMKENEKINIYCATEHKTDLLKIEVFRIGSYSSSGSRPILTLNDVKSNNQLYLYNKSIISRIFNKKNDEYLFAHLLQ